MRDRSNITMTGILIARPSVSSPVSASIAVALACLTLCIGSVQANAVSAECLAIESSFARNQLSQLIALEPTKLRWRALQQFRLAATYIPTENKPAAREAIRAGLDIVATAVKRDGPTADILLLGTMLDAQYLLIHPWRFFYNGSRALRRLGKAEKLDPDNPRVALVRATAKIVLPKALGGDVKAAEAMLKEALGKRLGDGPVFSESQLCGDGHWAQVDMLGWLGRAYVKQGDEPSARAAYQRALTYSPNNHWVKLAIAGEGYEWSDENNAADR